MSHIRRELEALGSRYNFPEVTVDVERVRRRNEEFMRAAGLCKDEDEFRWFQKIDNGLIGCMAYCLEPEEIAQLGADLIAWLFHFDDKIGEGKSSPTLEDLQRRLASFLETCRTGQPQNPNCPFEVALVGLIQRGVAMGGPGWQAKFTRSFAIYFEGLKGEYELRFCHRPLNLETYRIVRRGSIAAYPVLDLIELKFGKVVDHPELSHLRDLTADMLGWVNDLCSLEKELDDFDPVNIASVVAREYDESLDRGFSLAISKVHDVTWAEFQATQQRILNSDADDEVKAITHSLRKWVEATYHWSFRTRRYTDIYNDRLPGPTFARGNVILN